MGLSEHPCDSVENLLRLMCSAHGCRSVGCTGANSESSRSHLIMQIELKESKQMAPTNNSNRRLQRLVQPANNTKWVCI